MNKCMNSNNESRSIISGPSKTQFPFFLCFSNLFPSDMEMSTFTGWWCQYERGVKSGGKEV